MGSGIGRFASALRKHRVGEPLSDDSLQSRSDSGGETAIAASTPDQQASDHSINRSLLKTRRFLFRSIAQRRSAGFHTAPQNFISDNLPINLRASGTPRVQPSAPLPLHVVAGHDPSER